jgi:hypothetical protein
MSRGVAVVLKLNVVGRGYTQLWHPREPRLDVGLVDQALPIVDESAPRALAYAATRLDHETALLSVGGYWPDQTDEHGRPGLTGACALLCRATSPETLAWQRLGGRLITLYRRWLDDFDKIGDLIGRIARDPGASGEIATLVDAVEDDRAPSVTREILEMSPPPVPSNLRGSGPARVDHEVLGLIRLLMSGPDVGRVGGGILSPRRAHTYQHIASPREMPGFTRLDLRPGGRSFLPMPTVRSAWSRHRLAKPVAAVALGAVIVLSPGVLWWISSPGPAGSYATLERETRERAPKDRATYLSGLKKRAVKGWTGSLAGVRRLDANFVALDIDVDGTPRGPEVEVRVPRAGTLPVRGHPVRFSGVIDDAAIDSAGHLRLRLTGEVETVQAAFEWL